MKSYTHGFSQTLIVMSLVLPGLNCGGIGATPEASIGAMPSKGPVGKTMHSNSDKFVLCARDAVTVQTGATQTLGLRFTIDSEGLVKKPWVETITSPDPDLQTCVTRTLKAIKFPPPKDGQPHLISYPLVLRPE